MYKKIANNEKVTRQISDVHSADNYLTKDTTENVSLAVNKLNGILETSTIKNERVYYFINANVDFIIDEEKVHFDSGDVLYLTPGTSFSADGEFEAVVVNVPAYGVIK